MQSLRLAKPKLELPEFDMVFFVVLWLWQENITEGTVMQFPESVLARLDKNLPEYLNKFVVVGFADW